ncbi:MAG: hypothetical protein JEZ08_05170 [Clostridiales bacterium]|nr:hypothetical protein [Clostridiales bacterium]
MKKIINIAVIAIVLSITYITTIILRAHYSTSIGFSLSYDNSSVVILILVLIGAALFNLHNKSWKMLAVSLLGLVEIIIIGLLLWNL